MDIRQACVALATVGLAAAAGQATGAPVTFSTAQLASDGSNLNNAGTELTAVNFVDANDKSITTASPTINGITFAAFAGNNTSGNEYFGTTGSGLDYNRASGTASTAAIYPLVYHAAIANSDDAPFDITLESLTVGTEYRFQLVLTTSDTVRRVNVSSGGSSITNVEYGTNFGPQLVTGTFTADAATQLFSIVRPNNQSFRPQIAGFVLQAVPEPASATAMLLGATLLTGRRRRSL